MDGVCVDLGQLLFVLSFVPGDQKDWNNDQTRVEQGLQSEHQIAPINPFEGPETTGLSNIMTLPNKFNSKPTNTFVFLKS